MPYVGPLGEPWDVEEYDKDLRKKTMVVVVKVPSFNGGGNFK